MNLSDDVRGLVAKYSESHDPSEVLKKLSTLCELELSNIILHKRLDDDVFELFDRDNEEAMKVKNRMSGLARVVSYHTTSSCSQFVTDAVIEFAESNLSVQDIGSLAAETSTNAKNSKKRSKSGVMQVDRVRLYYEYNEQTVGSAERPPGVSVLESPCKTINLTVSMSRGAAGLDKCVVIDFEMLTSKFSPSENKIPLNNNSDDSDSVDDDNNAGSVGSDPEEIEDDDKEGPSDEGSESVADDSHGSHPSNTSDAGVDCSDYYNVRVDEEALQQLCSWLSFGDVESFEPSNKKQRSHSRRNQGASHSDDDDNSGDGGLSESCQDMLMFLLSVPFVDDSWTVHTLILDHVLGNDDGADEGYDDEEEDDA